jgi:hypothetical protein
MTDLIRILKADLEQRIIYGNYIHEYRGTRKC